MKIIIFFLRVYEIFHIFAVEIFTNVNIMFFENRLSVLLF